MDVRKVLIVEDSRATRELLAAAVEVVDGVEVYTAVSGFEALKVLPRYRFSLIITDINMPDINGLELASFIKGTERYASIPLVIVSTEGAERDVEKGLGIGADAYLVKPFDPDALRQIVLDLLAGRSQER